MKTKISKEVKALVKFSDDVLNRKLEVAIHNSKNHPMQCCREDNLKLAENIRIAMSIK